MWGAFSFLLINLVYRPSRVLARAIFYRVIVRFYRFYFSLSKKWGWEKWGGDIFSFLFGYKLVHVLVAAITVSLVFVNLTSKTKAEGQGDGARGVILVNFIKSEFEDIEKEEKLIVETFDREAVISAAHKKYLDNLSSVSPEMATDPDPPEDQDGEADLMATIHGGSSIIRPDIASTRMTKRQRAEAVIYGVKPGDTISTIAEEFEVSVNTILWENDLSAYNIIRPGDKLTILPASGLTHKVARGENLGGIAKKYGIGEEKIIESNKAVDFAALQIGQALFIPGGTKAVASYSPPRYSGISAIRDIVRSPDAKPVAGNMMNWPTPGHRITQYYSWKHNAVDIGDKTGTPIYAADAGVVESIGWGTGYGNQIVINHGGGKKTRYAHLSKFHVEKGQKVGKGEVVAAMGSTGWSTGPHLHFEIIINNSKVNPLNYIK